MMSDDDDIIILDVKEEPREITHNHHNHHRQSNLTVNNNNNNHNNIINNNPHYADFSAGLRFKPLNTITPAAIPIPTPTQTQTQPQLTSHLNVLVENEPKVREIEYPISPPISRKNSLSPTGIKDSSSPTTNNPQPINNNPPITTNNPPITTNNPPITTNNPPITTNNPPEPPALTIKSEITLPKKDVKVHLKRIDELIGMDAMSITLTPGVVHTIGESASPKAKRTPLDPKTPKNRTRKPNEKIRTAPSKAPSNEPQSKKPITTTTTPTTTTVQREISNVTNSLHNKSEINATKKSDGSNGSNEQRKPLSNITTTSSELNNRSEHASNTPLLSNKTPVMTTEAPRKALLIDSRNQVIDIPTPSRPSILSTPSTTTTTTASTITKTTSTTSTSTTTKITSSLNSAQTKSVTKSVKFADSVKETPQPSTKATLTNTAKTIPVHISRSPTTTSTSDMTKAAVPKSANVNVSNNSQTAKPPKPPIIANNTPKVSMDRSISVPSAPSPTIQPTVLNRQLSESSSLKASKTPLGHFKPVELSKYGIEQPKERSNKASPNENVIVINLNANHNSSDLSDPRIGPRFTAMKQQLEELLMCIIAFNKRLIGSRVNSLPNFVEVNMNMDENVLHDSLERFFTAVAAKVTTANMWSIIRLTRLVRQQKVLIEHYETAKSKKSSEWVNAVVDAVKINVISEIIRLFVNNGDGCIVSDCVDRLPKFLNNILMPMSSGGCGSSSSKDPRRNRFGNDSVGFDNYVVNARVGNIYEQLAVLRFSEAGEVPEKVSSATKAVEVGEMAKSAHLVRMRPHKEQISSTDLRVISEVIAEKATNVEGVEKHGEILKCFDTILKKWNVKVAPVVDDESEKKKKDGGGGGGEKKKDVEGGGDDDEVVVLGAEKENIEKGKEKEKEKSVKAVNCNTLSYEIQKSIEKKEKELKEKKAMSKKRRSRSSSSSSSSSSSWKSSSSNRSSTSRSRSRSRKRSGSRGRERSRSPRVHRKRFRDHSSNSSKASREGRNLFARQPSANHRRDHERYRQPHKHLYNNSSTHGKKRSRTKSRSRSRSRSGSRGRSGSYKKHMHKKI